MNALRKPKRQELSERFLKLDPTAPHDPALGQKLWDWYASAQAPPWTPEEAKQNLLSYAKLVDDLDNFFLTSLTLLAASGLGWPADKRPDDKGLAVMARYLVAYVRAADQSRQKMDRVHEHKGVAYRPLSAAAELANTTRQTIHKWIKNKTEFAGKPLQSYYFAPLDSYFVSEESIERMANRFVKWPSEETAGSVTIGATKDRNGYLGTTEAARVIGVKPQTVWLWVQKKGNPPTDKPLDMVKCTTSERIYIREKDVYELKKHLPKSGLRRGRRPQPLTPK